jgi:hypothetical protein
LILAIHSLSARQQIINSMVIQKVLNENINSDIYLIIAKMEEEF